MLNVIRHESVRSTMQKYNGTLSICKKRENFKNKNAQVLYGQTT